MQKRPKNDEQKISMSRKTRKYLGDELKRKYIVALLTVISAVIIVTIFSNPLIYSESIIKNRLIKATPLGTNMNTVIAEIENNENYSIMYISYNHGYGIARYGPGDAAVSPGEEEVGKKSIKVHLGEYKVTFCVDVIAYYGFNEENELVGIEVAKELDSI